jgi:hypothetical protein
MKTKTEDFETRAKTYIKESNKLAKKLKLQVFPAINFNNRKRNVPLLGRIAMFLLQRSGGFIDTHFKNIK